MFLKLCLALLALNLTNAATIHKKDDSKTPWQLIEALTATASIKGFNGTWMSDEEIYFRNKEIGINKYNARTGQTSLFIDSNFLNTYGSQSTFTLSPDASKILVRYDVEEVFRHSFIARYDVFDIATQEAIKIFNGTKLQYCAWSPVKDKLSFVHENNVYVHFSKDLEVNITSDGTSGVVYNGVPDWVYEEEVLSSGSAMWWSPDGNKLAVGYFNDTNVTSFKYQLYGDEREDYLYPKEIDLKYPKPGSANPMVFLKVFDLTAGNRIPVNLSAPVDIVSADHILQNVAWSDNENLLITWLNRRQNISSIQTCSYKGECREVRRIKEPKGWISMGNPMCLSSGKSCMFTYWIDNWYQIWNLNLTDGQNLWKSRGNFTVLKIYGYDEPNDKLYYLATIPNDPSNYQVFSNDECLSCNLKDVDGASCLSATATFSKNYSYYSITCNGPNPSYTLIFEAKTRTQKLEWELNSDFRKALAKKLRPDIEFHNVTLADNSTGYLKLLLPKMEKNKKYPMIVYVYGGPNSVRTTNAFTVGFDAYLTTSRSVIVAIIDGRGTGNKGKDLLFSVNNNLGEYEVEDQIHVTKYLQTLPYVDPQRTGIWGWSYGGYMTAKTIENDSDHVYQCGISVAPVTSWLYYDTIYTERYMGLPTNDDNSKKYNDSSVLVDVKNFRTHDFLLVHGSGDDNVHYQHSLLLAKLLQQNDILFEQMTYTDENHSIGRLLPHLYNTMDHFWLNCLNIDGDDF